MCELCNKIYTEEEEKEGAMFEDHCGLYIKVEPRLRSSEKYYHLCEYDFCDFKELTPIKFCPECGKKLYEDVNYHGSLLNKNYRIVKYY